MLSSELPSRSDIKGKRCDHSHVWLQLQRMEGIQIVQSRIILLYSPQSIWHSSSAKVKRIYFSISGNTSADVCRLISNLFVCSVILFLHKTLWLIWLGAKNCNFQLNTRNFLLILVNHSMRFQGENWTWSTAACWWCINFANRRWLSRQN